MPHPLHPDAPTGTLDGNALHAAGKALFAQVNLVRWYEYTNLVKNGQAQGTVAPLPMLGAKGRTPVVTAASDPAPMVICWDDVNVSPSVRRASTRTM